MDKDIKVKTAIEKIIITGLHNGTQIEVDFQEAVGLCKDLKIHIRELAANEYLKLKKIEDL